MTSHGLSINIHQKNGTKKKSSALHTGRFYIIIFIFLKNNNSSFQTFFIARSGKTNKREDLFKKVQLESYFFFYSCRMTSVQGHNLAPCSTICYQRYVCFFPVFYAFFFLLPLPFFIHFDSSFSSHSTSLTKKTHQFFFSSIV